MLSEIAQTALWKLLSQDEESAARDVFVILDGASVQVLPDYAAERKAEFACLYIGETDPRALARAPFLVRVAAGSELARWLLEEGWGRNWGLFALCSAGTDLDTVLRDLQEILVARLPDGRVVRFRFYDPRIWRPFFLTCGAEQLRQLYGRAVQAFACEDAGGEALLLDTRPSGQAKRVTLPLPR
jgi:hypothetical protein